jgi:aspartate/methionine/tyrosine aminotransferase
VRAHGEAGRTGRPVPLTMDGLIYVTSIVSSRVQRPDRSVLAWVVSVSFPNNPTGAVPDADTWRRLADFCDERGILLFSDEAYRGLELSPRTPLPQAADLSPTALSVNVMSKAYDLPGLGIGWIACRDRDLLGGPERAAMTRRAAVVLKAMKSNSCGTPGRGTRPGRWPGRGAGRR